MASTFAVPSWFWRFRCSFSTRTSDDRRLTNVLFERRRETSRVSRRAARAAKISDFGQIRLPRPTKGLP
jgi:hypothetical protein